MTDAMMNEVATLGKRLLEGWEGLLREVLATALARVMEAEVTALCGAGRGERDPERTNRRNGYRDRPLETRMGTIGLRIPKLRQGSYLPGFVEPRRRWERAFVNVVSEAYVLGVSTRRVEQLVEALGATGMSKSEVKRGRRYVYSAYMEILNAGIETG